MQINGPTADGATVKPYRKRVFQFLAYLLDIYIPALWLNELLWARPDMFCTATGRGMTHLVCSLQVRNSLHLLTSMLLFGLFLWKYQTSKPIAKTAGSATLPPPSAQVQELASAGALVEAIRAYRLEHSGVSLADARRTVMANTAGTNAANNPVVTQLDEQMQRIESSMSEARQRGAMIGTKLTAFCSATIGAIYLFGLIWIHPAAVCNSAGTGWLHVSCSVSARLSAEVATILLLAILVVAATYFSKPGGNGFTSPTLRGSITELWAAIRVLPPPSEATMAIYLAGRGRTAAQMYQSEHPEVSLQNAKLRLRLERSTRRKQTPTI